MKQTADQSMHGKVADEKNHPEVVITQFRNQYHPTYLSKQ
jgi:ribosomal protein S17